MKGVLLVGGIGSRLRPVTAVTNKHLLPVYDRPMIFWPLEVFRANAIHQVLVVSGREHMGDVFRLLGSGREHGMDFTFRVQDEAGGIAQALALAEEFVDPGPAIAGGEFLVVLGDNVFLPPPLVPGSLPSASARVWLKKVPDPRRYGVPEFDWEGGLAVIRRIVEKPERPPSDFAVVGLYQYDSRVFEIIRGLAPSARGELEVSDVNNAYALGGDLFWQEIAGYWGDAGSSPAGLLAVGIEVAEIARTAQTDPVTIRALMGDEGL